MSKCVCERERAEGSPFESREEMIVCCERAREREFQLTLATNFNMVSLNKSIPALAGGGE